MSLTELAFIVVFVVLLLFASSARTELEAREKQSGRIAEQEKFIERDQVFRQELFAAAPETVRSDDDLVRLVRETPQLRDDNRKLESKLREAEDRAELADRKFEELQASEEEKAAAETIAECKESLDDCDEEGVKLRGQLANLTGRGGIDHPPCWPDPASPSWSCPEAG